VSTESDLIYDVGVHNGDDTGYYLHLGYRVVAVEANPMWAQRVSERFAHAVSSGRLTVVNVAIGSQPGEADFHISTVNDAWGSFDTQIASRGGAFTTIRVPCVPFGGVLAEHGVPHYLKVDIEGNDRLCLQALGPGALPAFASVEMDHGDGDRDIATLTVRTVRVYPPERFRRGDRRHGRRHGCATAAAGPHAGRNAAGSSRAPRAIQAAPTPRRRLAVPAGIEWDVR
jgi:FkbM family methyltransferase